MPDLRTYSSSQFRCSGADADDLPGSAQPDDLQDYAMALAFRSEAPSISGAFRRVIAQLGGMLALAQATGRRNLVDEASMKRMRIISDGARDNLAGLATPRPAASLHDYLEEAGHHVLRGLDLLWTAHRDDDTSLESVIDKLTRADALLNLFDEEHSALATRSGCYEENCRCGNLAC